MRRFLRPFSTVLLVCAALTAPTGFGQSLSIIKEGETDYSVKATAPSGNPQMLQASQNLHLWINIQDDVEGQYSERFDGSGVSQRYFRLSPAASAEPLIVMLLGDSLTSDCCGWGGGIYAYFRPEAKVVNYATAGATTKSFLRSAEYDNMLLVKPNYVLIQFGYVDQAWGPDLAPDYYTSPQEFADNLRKIVNVVRGFNGIPILITVHSGRVWDAEGRVIPTWQERNAITKQVAAELQTPLLDLNQLTMDLFNELGPSCESFMHLAGFPDNDVLHMSPLGALFVSRLVVNALPDQLGPYLKGIFDPPPRP